MKLAQALTERADAQKRIEQLRYRLEINAKVQQGEQPAEKPETLMAELDELFVKLEGLITAINKTNAVTIVDGATLTELLARRDCLNLKVGVLRGFLNEASSTVIRGTRTEIKIVSTVDVAAIQKNVDALSKELRELDVRIQELNWTTELL